MYIKVLQRSLLYDYSLIRGYTFKFSLFVFDMLSLIGQYCFESRENESIGWSMQEICTASVYVSWTDPNVARVSVL
jgi:hypothetical protein